MPRGDLKKIKVAKVAGHVRGVVAFIAEMEEWEARGNLDDIVIHGRSFVLSS